MITGRYTWYTIGLAGSSVGATCKSTGVKVAVGDAVGVAVAARVAVAASFVIRVAVGASVFVTERAVAVLVGAEMLSVTVSGEVKIGTLTAVGA